MEDMLSETKALGDLLREHKGDNVVVLDLRKIGTQGAPCTWTDFFVIATATSSAHLDGLERHIKEFCREREIEILRRSLKPKIPAGMQSITSGEDEWRIIDLGAAVIHLMSRKARDFYELELLYSDAETV